MLHAPVNDTGGIVYCGPTAIAAITGQPISVIYKRIRRVRADGDRRHYGKVINGGNVKRSDGRKRRIVGTYPAEVLKVLKRLGRKVIEKGSPGCSLRAFCDDRGHMGPYLVQVTGHFVAVSRGMICDTATKQPIPWQDYHRLQRKVVKWWRLSA